MKHVFVVNPCAGKQDATGDLTQKIEAFAGSTSDFDYLIYHTHSPGDATGWVRQWCQSHPGQEARFYACGGDGTLNEVVSGCIGFPQVQVSVHANGSGNDYIKYYGTVEDFTDIARLVSGIPHRVDVMSIDAAPDHPGNSPLRYSINVCNFGFDAMVCKTGNQVRRKPLIGGRNAYTTGIVASLFTSRSNYICMQVDQQPFFDGHMLLCTIGNGRYNGGNYMCSPLSLNDDGLLEVNLFKRMSLLRFASLVKDYSHGTHIQRSDVQRLMRYRQAHMVDLSSPHPFWLVIDGEMLHSNRYLVRNLHHAVTFVSPRQ